MRQVSLREVPTAILSRQTAGIRGKSLIINVPGKPSSIKTCLDAVFPAVPYCLDLIGGRVDRNARRGLQEFSTRVSFQRSEATN